MRIQVTRRAGPSRCCSHAAALVLPVAKALAHQLGGAITRQPITASPPADPALVAPLVAYILSVGEGCKRRTDGLTPGAAQSARAVHTLLPNWETGEAHQDARDEPTMDTMLLFWSVVNVSRTE